MMVPNLNKLQAVEMQREPEGGEVKMRVHIK